MKYLLVIEDAGTNLGAYFPDVQGCVTLGDTVEEVKANALEALELHLSGEDSAPCARSLRDILDTNELDGVTVEAFTWVEYEHSRSFTTACVAA